jgi:acetyltransferase-like isoleucine patch superfamily enzyme
MMMTLIKQILSILIRAPRRFRSYIFIYWNRFVFWCKGAVYGNNMRVNNHFYLMKHFHSKLIIGNNFTFSSGSSINPLCRNIRGCIYLPEPSSIIIIGDNSGMSSACLWAKERITIGNRVKIGGDCILMDTDAHNLDYRMRSSNEMIGSFYKDSLTAASSPITIEDDVLVGARCIILKGVTIGARSIIGSGSVVTKSIPSDCIAAGNPCRIIRNLNQNKQNC